MKKETYIRNLNFIRIQARSLYIDLLKNDLESADEVLEGIDESICAMIDDVENLFRVAGGDEI